MQPETTLDTLEATTQVVGHALLRRTLQAPWGLVDAALTEQYRLILSASVNLLLAHPTPNSRLRSDMVSYTWILGAITVAMLPSLCRRQRPT